MHTYSYISYNNVVYNDIMHWQCHNAWLLVLPGRLSGIDVFRFSPAPFLGWRRKGMRETCPYTHNATAAVSLRRRTCLKPWAMLDMASSRSLSLASFCGGSGGSGPSVSTIVIATANVYVYICCFFIYVIILCILMRTYNYI